MNDTAQETIERLFFEKALSFGDTCQLVSRVMGEKL